MTLQQIRVRGIDALNLASALLQRMRLADPLAGVWEAADVQWWWGIPRSSDRVDQIFWADERGPVAGVYATSWRNDRWEINPIIVPGISSVSPNAVWQTTQDIGEQYAPNGYDVPFGDDDAAFRTFASASGLVAGDSDWTGWMPASDVPEVAPLPEGFTIVDRRQRADQPHPMAARNGESIAARLSQLSLYDPSLDLAIETEDGRHAAYILFWIDPVTNVGMIEPVRTEDDFQRRGLARALITYGMNLLVEKGATRLKVSWETEAAGALYSRVGFQVQSTSTWYRSSKRT